jgi:hypothetical protein
MDHDRYVAKRGSDRRWVREVGLNEVKTVALGLRAKTNLVAARQYDIDARFLRKARDQITGVSVGTVN